MNFKKEKKRKLLCQQMSLKVRLPGLCLLPGGNLFGLVYFICLGSNFRRRYIFSVRCNHSPQRLAHGDGGSTHLTSCRARSAPSNGGAGVRLFKFWHSELAVSRVLRESWTRGNYIFGQRDYGPVLWNLIRFHSMPQGLLVFFPLYTSGSSAAGLARSWAQSSPS